VYHFIVLPVEVAVSCDDEPHIGIEGVAETAEGVAGGVIVTTTL
jgi:hypothetical protein